MHIGAYTDYWQDYERAMEHSSSVIYISLHFEPEQKSAIDPHLAPID